ncbi:MAG: penicillin-binding protein [Lachnospiraceae bacterium]|nr:penicillin-binding protein [Lachnospiraceae bacterium]
MVKQAIKSFFQVISSRLFLLGTVFAVLFAILVVRIFHLQIVNGESYLNDYLYQTERTIDIPSTRGNIYDCNGKPLAYNELVHSVVIADDGSQNNRELNETIYKAIQLIEKNGDMIVGDFPIAMDENGDFFYTTTSDVSRLRFLADAYGFANISDLDTEEETRSTKTAEEVFLYLCTRRYNLQSDLSVLLMSEEEVQALGDQPVYDTEDALKILAIRYSLSTTSYRRYISVTMASDVNASTVAAIKECEAELPGVNIEEETKRKYTDSTYFAHILGYTGRASKEDLDELKEENPSYTSEDMVGKDGLEAYLELGLQGTKGSIKAYVDSQGTILDITEQTDPVAGNDYYLTIDSDLQKEAFDMFESYLAGILVTKIVNRDVKITKEMSASQRYISVKDAYYALFNNGIIDISHFEKEDATEVEKEVYRIYCEQEDKILARMRDELTKENPVIYSKLPEEYQVYMSYTYSVLAKTGVLLTNEIDTNDKTYKAWREDDSISLQEFLLYAITKGWIDTTKLDAESKYSDMQEIYASLVNYIEKRLKADVGFSKKIYRYMVENYTISPSQICLLLFEQNVIEYNEEDYQRLLNGNSAAAYNFFMDKIRNIEITPAQLALDPCSGSVCLVDVNTGAVKALVIYPSYDNNKFSGYMDAEYWNRLANDESNAKPLYNRATMTETAPGSTFKMISAIAGLEEGVISTTERIYDNVVFDTVLPAVKCWSSASHGRETVVDAIMNSCNYYFYEVGYRLSLDESGVYTPELGNEKLKKYADMFGLGTTSGIELSEAAPQISTEYPIQSAIGQGNNDFTNVQLARYVATIANGGTNRKLTLLDKRTDSEGNIQERYHAEITNQVQLKESTWESVHRGMELVVSRGSVRSIFKDVPFTVAGKTGTAQENPMRPNHAVFVGYAPCENPEIAVSVLIPNGYTSSYAAEIARNALMLYYNVDEETMEEAMVPGDTIVVD